MCGILGFLTNSPKAGFVDRRNWFKQALFCDTLRGYHSTGLILFNSRQNVLNTYKKAVPAYDMMEMKQFDKLMTDMDDYTLAVGHNRAATKGRVTSANAHPFHCNNIIGVHNGTLSSMMNLDDFKEFEVDSECIFHNIQKNGAQSTIEKLDGAYALVWYDTETSTTHIIRNKERGLAYAVCEDTSTLLFASEPGMLAWLAARNKINIKQIQMFDEMYEYIFKDGDILNFTKEKRKEYQPIKHYGSGHGYYFNGKWIPHGSNAGTANRALPVSSTSKVPGVKRGKRKSQSVLEHHGYEIGEELLFFLTDFQSYNHPENTFGKGLGFTSDDGEYHPVIVHGLTQDVFDESFNTECMAKIVGACNTQDVLAPHQSNEVMHLLVNGQSLRVIDPAPWGEEDKSKNKEGDIVNFPIARRAEKA